MTYDQAFVRRLNNLGPLHDLIIKACPVTEDRPMKSISRMAAETGYTPAGLYKAISLNKITHNMVDKLMEVVDPLSGVTREDFAPYLDK